MTRAALSLVLLLSPGLPAWGQVARAVRPVPAAPVFPVGAAAFAAPSLAAPAFRPSLPSPSLSPAPTPSPTLPAAPASAAVAVSAAARAPVRAVSVAVAQTAKAAAAPLAAVAESAAGGSAAQGREAGQALEDILLGRRVGVSSPEAVLAAPAAPARRSLNRAVPDSPAAAPEVPAPARRAFSVYTAGVSVVKVGIETLNLVVPVILLTQYGTAAVLGALFVAAQVAGLAAGAALAPVIDRLGPAKTLAAAAALQAAVIGVVPLSLFLGAPVSLPVLFGLFTVNGALTGVFDIARRSAPPSILGADEGTLRRFNARLYIFREIAAMGAVFGAGWLLHSVGALTTLGVHPASYAMAAGLFFLLSRMRAARPSAAPAAKTEPEPRAGTRWAEWAAGARITMSDPALRLAALVNIPVIALHNMFHAMLAAVYATSVLGSPAMAAVLIGAWNAGELASALFLERRGEKTGAAGWMRYAALAALAGWALWAFPTIWVAAPVAFLLATATLGNEIGLNSFFQAAAPKDRTAAVTGFVYSAATGAAMLLTLAFGWAFDAFGALPGFLALAVLLSGASVLYLRAARAVARRTPPSTPSS